MISTCVRRFWIPLVTLASLVLLVAYGCGAPPIPPTDGTGGAEPSVPLTSGAAGDTPDVSATTRPASSSPTATDPAVSTMEAPTGDPNRLCAVPSDELDAAFVADLGLPDGTLVAPGAWYRETWRVRNTGSCTWPEGTELVFVSGDPIPGPQRALVSQVGPGRDVDISVEFRAPMQPARYASYWRLQAPGGQRFGAIVYAGVVVSSDAVVPVTIPDTAPRPSPTLQPITPPMTYAIPAVPSPLPTRPSASPLTPTPTANGGLTCGTPDQRFGPLVRQAHALGIDLPCTLPVDATGNTVTSEPGIVQTFWQEIDQSDPSVRLRSFVVVRKATHTIYVLRGKDAATYHAEARAYEDTWSAAMPEQPEACAPLVPPPGYIMPTENIGELWCEQSLWNSIGWPVAEADAVTLIAQGDRNKLLVQVTGEDAGTYLLAIDLDARAATAYQTP